MAAIDKIYLDSYEEYITFKNWCEDKYVKLLYGDEVLYLKDYFYEWTEEAFIRSLPIACFRTAIDIYLIRNCPFDFIQEELKFQYCSSYDEIKNKTSEFDTYQRNGKGKDIKFKIIKKPDFHLKSRNWFIEIYDEECFWTYNDYSNTFSPIVEQPTDWTSSSYFIKGTISKGKIYRLLKRWNLPAGLTVKITGRYVGQIYLLKTK
jgi:hypothetical protein